MTSIFVGEICSHLGGSFLSSSFARWLQQQLTNKGWDQADFARELQRVKGSGPPPTGGVSMWLSGERHPSSKSCDWIAEALSIDADVVLEVAGHRPTVEPIDPNSVEAELIGLVKRVRSNDERASGIRLALTNNIQHAPR